MRPTSKGSLLLVAVVVGVVAWSALRLVERSGGLPLPLPWTALGGMLVLVAAVVAAGWPVRRWTRGDRTRRLDALQAARTLVLARAAAYAGAALTGFYAAQGLLALPNLDVEPRRERLLMAALAMGCALLMVVAGLVVEHWCRTPSDEDEDAENRHV
jgi:hypothetical protein